MQCFWFLIEKKQPQGNNLQAYFAKNIAKRLETTPDAGDPRWCLEAVP